MTANESTTHATHSIDQIINLLRATEKLASSASLTGHLKEGEARCIKQFNNALNHLEEIEKIPQGLFDPLGDDATFGEISVACTQLLAMIEHEKHDHDHDHDHSDRHRQRNRRREQRRDRKFKKPFGEDFFGKEFESVFQEMGDVFRETMPTIQMKIAQEMKKAAEKIRAEQQKIFEEAQNEADDVEVEIVDVTSDEDDEMSILNGRMLELTAILKTGDLSEDEIAEIASEMKKIGKQMSKLAQSKGN